MIIPQPMEKNSSVCTKVGHCVVSWGSSKPNPSEKKEIIEGATFCSSFVESFYYMLSDWAKFLLLLLIIAGIPICPSKNLSNEPISTAYGEHIVEMEKALFDEIGDEMQNPLFHEIGEPVELTNDGGKYVTFNYINWLSQFFNMLIPIYTY